MHDPKTLIAIIQAAFAKNVYPGDAYLLGSREGTEPFDEVGPFQGKRNWDSIEPQFLDQHAVALSFFSEAGLRFFLPAYLIADLRGQLQNAEPDSCLTLGFSDVRVETRISGETICLRTGKSRLINPHRYGAATLFDYARYRLSIFTREESAAIVQYLEWKRDSADLPAIGKTIEAALDGFWRERVRSAPSAKELLDQQKEQQTFLDATTGLQRNE